MADRWHVHRSDGSALGPLTPLEVRDALREGSIDPFDQVTRDGSKVKLVLVEVDEIFRAADAADRRESVYEEPEKKDKTSISEDGRRTVLKQPVKSIATTKKPPPRSSAKKRKVASKRNAKSFHLIDKRKRMLGPLSAGEIQSLFYRGILDHKVMVVKEKSEKQVPIAQFVAAYAGEQVKLFKSEKTQISLDSSSALPNSKVLDQLSKAAALTNVRRENLVPLIVSLSFMLIGGVLAYMAFDRVILEESSNINPVVQPRGPAINEQPIVVTPAKKARTQVQKKPKKKPRVKKRNSKRRTARVKTPK